MATNQEKVVSKEYKGSIVLGELLEQMQRLDLKSTNNVITIPDWLKDCESPFLWHSLEKRGLGSEHVIMRCLEKLEELKLDEPEFSLQRFITLLKLVIEYYTIGDKDKVLETMETIDALLDKEVSGNDAFYQKVKLSLGHVISTTKANLFSLYGEEERSKKIGQNIIPVKVMTNHDQAAMLAMKARFYLYASYENGENLGVDFARKASELEPDNEEWQFLLAKMLRQKRKDVPFSMDIPREELVLLEKVLEKSQSAKILVYLAQVYRECGSQAYRQYRQRADFQNSELNKTIQEMHLKALKYYKEALAQSSDSPSNLRRIGYGIMNLPKHVADYDLALDCLLRSLKLSENLVTLHILGTFYHRYGNDNKTALEYFDKTAKAGSHAGLSDFVRVKYIVDPEYNPCEDLESGLKWEMKRKNISMLLTQLGGYYLIMKRDFHKSLEYFNKVIEEDKDSVHMKTFKSLFLRMYDPIDLYLYIANEALLLLQKEDKSVASVPDSSTSDEEEMNHQINLGLVEDLVAKITKIHPKLVEITPDPTLIDKLHEMSKIIHEKETRNNRSQTFYKQGGYRPYQRGRVSRFRGNTYGRETGDSAERRGRYSVANQREIDSSRDNCEGTGRNRRHSSDNSERQGRFHQDGGQDENWRQEQLSRPARGQNMRRNGTGKTRQIGFQNWREKK